MYILKNGPVGTFQRVLIPLFEPEASAFVGVKRKRTVQLLQGQRSAVELRAQQVRITDFQVGNFRLFLLSCGNVP